jgi:hypothetical protein
MRHERLVHYRTGGNLMISKSRSWNNVRLLDTLSSSMKSSVPSRREEEESHLVHAVHQHARHYSL